MLKPFAKVCGSPFTPELYLVHVFKHTIEQKSSPKSDTGVYSLQYCPESATALNYLQCREAQAFCVFYVISSCEGVL